MGKRAIVVAVLLAAGSAHAEPPLPRPAPVVAPAPKLIERDVVIAEGERLRALTDKLEGELRTSRERATDVELALKRLHERFEQVYEAYKTCTLDRAPHPEPAK